MKHFWEKTESGYFYQYGTDDVEYFISILNSFPRIIETYEDLPSMKYIKGLNKRVNTHSTTNNIKSTVEVYVAGILF